MFLRGVTFCKKKHIVVKNFQNKVVIELYLKFFSE